MRRLVLISLVILFSGCVDKGLISPNLGNLSLKNLNLSSLNISDLNISDIGEDIPFLGKSDEIHLKVGESAEYGGINVTLVEAKFSKDLHEFETFYPIDPHMGIAPEGYKFLVIYVKIVNNGNNTIYPTAHDFIVADSKKNVYSYHALTHAFQDCLELKELKKGEETEGRIVFLVPENETFKVAYNFQSLADFRSFFDFFKTKWAVWEVG